MFLFKFAFKLLIGAICVAGCPRDNQRTRIARGASEEQFEGFFLGYVLWTEVGWFSVLFSF